MPLPHPGVLTLAAGMYHTCALLIGGGVECWGLNGYGELGTGDTTDRLTPTGVTGVSAGANLVLIFSLLCIVGVCTYGERCIYVEGRYFDCTV